MKYRRGWHNVYLLTYHMIFVIKYRKPLIDEEMSVAMKLFAKHMTELFGGELISAETDKDHIHLLVSMPINTDLPKFVRSIKTQISREMRTKFPDKIHKYLYGDKVPFWSNSYFIATTGSVSLETFKKYIESQKTEEHHRRKAVQKADG